MARDTDRRHQCSRKDPGADDRPERVAPVHSLRSADRLPARIAPVARRQAAHQCVQRRLARAIDLPVAVVPSSDDIMEPSFAFGVV
jgi:hypothetical protein